MSSDYEAAKRIAKQFLAIRAFMTEWTKYPRAMYCWHCQVCKLMKPVEKDETVFSIPIDHCSMPTKFVAFQLWIDK